MDKRGFKETVTYEFPGSILIKGEGDGSSVPSGGLR
jgi:glutamine synthetase